MSLASKGNYYKRKTKEFLEKQGYAVELVEKYLRIFKQGKVLMIKKDVFGADGIAMNGEEIIFWNSVFGKDHIARAYKKFLEFPYPPSVKRWVVAWEERAREPYIEEVKDG